MIAKHRLDLGLRPECPHCRHDQWVYELRPQGWTCQRHPDWFLDEIDFERSLVHTHWSQKDHVSNGRSRRVPLGFVVADTQTGEYLSEVFARREPARTAVCQMLEKGREHIGVHTMEAHVPATWRRGDSVDAYAEPRDLAVLRACPECLYERRTGLVAPVEHGCEAGDYERPGHTPNEDSTWREVYGREYRRAEAQGLQEWQAREEAAQAAWADYEARTGRKRFARNGGYYVWALQAKTDSPIEGPWGPHDLEGAKTFARIGATEGSNDRVVSRGQDPQAPSFAIVRRYQAGTGERLL